MIIHDLTTEQVAILNRLWKFNTIEEVWRYRDSLPFNQQQQINTLIEMVRLQALDDDITQTGDLSKAKSMLAPFMPKKS